MKRGGGKAKGSAFEREVGKLLTAVYYAEGDGLFQRIYSHPIPSKGDVRGDLQALRYFRDPISGTKQLIQDSTFPFVVECKNWHNVKPLFSGLYSKQSEVFDWIAQAQKVATTEENASDKKMSMVVFRLYRTGIVSMIDLKEFNSLQLLFGIPGCEFYMFSWRPAISGGSLASLADQSIGKGLIFMSFDGFTKWIDWGVYKYNARKYIRTLVPKE